MLYTVVGLRKGVRLLMMCVKKGSKTVDDMC